MRIDPGIPSRLRGVADELLRISAGFEGDAGVLRTHQMVGWTGPASQRHRQNHAQFVATLPSISASYAALAGAVLAAAQGADQLIAEEQVRLAQSQRNGQP